MSGSRLTMSSRWSSSLPASGGWIATPTVRSPADWRVFDELDPVAVAVHRRLELDDHAAGPTRQRGDVLAVGDGEHDVGRVGRSQRRREHHRRALGRQTLQLVDGADREQRADLDGGVGEPDAAEPVAVALDHRHQALDALGDVGDVGPPTLAVDAEPDRHGQRS